MFRTELFNIEAAGWRPCCVDIRSAKQRKPVLQGFQLNKSSDCMTQILNSTIRLQLLAIHVKTQAAQVKALTAESKAMNFCDERYVFRSLKKVNAGLLMLLKRLVRPSIACASQSTFSTVGGISLQYCPLIQTSRAKCHGPIPNFRALSRAGAGESDETRTWCAAAPAARKKWQPPWLGFGWS